MYVNDSDEPRGTLAYVDNFPAEAAAELDALRARVAAAEADAARYRFLRGRVEDYDGFACFESIPYPAPIPDRAPFNSIDDAVDTAMRAAADRASASAPDVHTPKPVCKHCGQFLDARGKCRVPEHNP